jgi:Kelch motif
VKGWNWTLSNEQPKEAKTTERKLMNKQNILGLLKTGISAKKCRRLAAAIILTAAATSFAPAAWAQASTWTPANPMNKARAFFTATKLLNGDVLVAGGYDGTVGPPIFPDAEIYNWHTGQWTLISPMNSARAGAVDIRLEDGRVLVIGGADADFNFLDSAEIYDPSTGTWSFTGLMNEPRFEDFTAVLLPGRKVLIAGGFGPGNLRSKDGHLDFNREHEYWA